MLVKLYQCLTVILSPLIDIYMLIRIFRGLEDKTRFNERFGYSSVQRPKGDIICFQCASVGESNSILSLLDEIIRRSDDSVTILITSGTVSSAKNLQKRLGNRKNIIHQYTPIDKYCVIKRFLKFWKPKALITVESEIWPVWITLSHKYCKKVMIVNAKISEKSFARWNRCKRFMREIFDSIDVCYPQDLESQRKLILMGIQNTLFLGNLKFDISKLPINNEYYDFLRPQISGRKMVLCASLHLEEVEHIIKIYQKLMVDNDNLLFILALRHINDSDTIHNVLKRNFIAKRKSLNESITLDTNFYIYDEMGLGTLFELSDIVLMCGSLIDGIGGHTPVEPAKHLCAIITAPYIKNNKSLFKEFEDNNACIISSVDNLPDEIQRLLNNRDKVETLQKNAMFVTEKYSKITGTVAENIIYNLKY